MTQNMKLHTNTLNNQQYYYIRHMLYKSKNIKNFNVQLKILAPKDQSW